MDTYSFLRELADSWVLLILTLFFLGVIAWSFRPGSRATHEDIADIPFRNDTLPNAPTGSDDSRASGPDAAPERKT